MVNKKTLSKLAEDAGDPYTGDELSADPIEKAKKFNEDHKQQLNDLPGME
ncbi:hypothetical protein J6O48_01830 [bacterium]|nr:hypothetical protein [bacterium]